MDVSNFEAIKADATDDPDRAIFTAAAIEGSKATAHRLLRAMLEGHAVSRLNCHHYEVAPENASIHSAASFLKDDGRADGRGRVGADEDTAGLDDASHWAFARLKPLRQDSQKLCGVEQISAFKSFYGAAHPLIDGSLGDATCVCQGDLRFTSLLERMPQSFG